VNKSYLILAYALTPVHVGMGRAPGIVDLPFQRDSIGYPIVYGSSFKGVLKSTLMNEGNDNKKALAKCLFGAEPDDESKYMGRFMITDLLPVFYPIASLDGYIYVTADYLMRKANDILSIIGNSNNNLYKENQSGKEVNVLLGKLKSAYTINIDQSPIKNLGNLIKDLKEVHVFSNDIGLQVIESSLIRITRNVLDDKNKTSQNLWIEEYLPQGTVFIGGAIDANRTNEICKNINVESEFSNKFNDIAIFLGGKETIGKGLVRIKVIQ